jgi:fructokinase
MNSNRNLGNFLKPESEFRVGIDLGGTKIECAVIDRNNNVLYRQRGPTQANLGRQQVLTNIRQQYLTAITTTSIGQHSVGLGTPGSVNAQTGLLRNSSIEHMNGHDIERDLACWLHQPVTVANDAQCFALAEARMGAGRGYDRVFGVILGTGVGGALVEYGRITRGRNGILGEWGHTTLNDRYNCRCGRRGCVESNLGGGAIQHSYPSKTNEIPPPADVILAQDPGRLLQWYRDYGLAMANLIQVLDPDCIVLGGGLSNLPDIMTTGDTMIREHLFSDAFDTVIVRAELGDSAGSVGAALLCKQ